MNDRKETLSDSSYSRDILNHSNKFSPTNDKSDQKDLNISSQQNTEENQFIMQASGTQAELNCFRFLTTNTEEDQEESIMSGGMIVGAQNNICDKVSQKQFYSEPSLSPEKPSQQQLQNTQQFNLNESNNSELFSPKLFVGCVIKDGGRCQMLKVERGRTKGTDKTNSVRSNSITYQRATSPLGQQRISYSLQQKGNSQDDYFHHLFTTQEPSKYLLKSKRSMSQNLIKTLLPSHENFETFISAFEHEEDQNFKLYLYDHCVNENQGQSLNSMNNAISSFLKNKQSTHQSVQSNYTNLDNDKANDLIFIFGQENANKQDLISPLSEKSILQYVLNHSSENVKYLRVSMFYLDKEHLLIQKSYQGQNKSTTEHELWKDLRQSFRNKQLVIKKLASDKKQQVQKEGTHLLIQVNNIIFVDLASIECLTMSANSSLVNHLTMNFSSITNEILKLSSYYKNHSFKISDHQEQSNFNQYLKSSISPDSRIIMLCCVTSRKDQIPQTLIALDYCQKIKCYFNGISEEEIQGLLKIQENLSQSVVSQEISQLFIALDKIQSKVLRAKKKTNNNIIIQRYLKHVEIIEEKVQNYISQNDKDIKKMAIQLNGDIMKTKVNILDQQQICGDISQRSPHEKQILNSNMKRSYSQSRLRGQKQNSHKLFKDQPSLNLNLNKNKLENLKSGKHTQRKLKSNRKSVKNIQKESFQFTPKQPNQSKTITDKFVQVLDKSNSKSLDPTAKGYQDYYEKLGSPDIKDPRDTPQFQEELQHQCSSLYVKTSVESQALDSKRDGQFGKRQNRLNSQLTSLKQDQGSLYYNTDQSIEKHGPQLNQIDTLQVKQGQHLANVKIQEKLIIALSENESLSNLKIIYEKQISQLKDQLELLQQLRSSTNNKVKTQLLEQKIDELKSQIMNQDEIITSSDFQLKQQQKIITQKSREIDDLQSEVRELEQNNQDQKETNKGIIHEIKGMKSIIEEFKGREKDYGKMVDKLKQQDKLIKELKFKLSENRKDESINLDENIIEYQEQIKKLEEDNLYQHSSQAQVLQFNNQMIQKIQVMEEKFTKLYVDYKQALEENKQFQKKLEKQEILIKQTEKAKENYKDQTIDLKQEIKHLKSHLKSVYMIFNRYLEH